MPGGLVGREEELRALRALLPRGGAGLVGPAGIGKTALVTRALAGQPCRIGGGLQTLRRRPYAALEQAMRRRLTGTPTEVAEQVLDHGAALLVVEDLHWIDEFTLDALAALVGHVPLVVTARPEATARVAHVVGADAVLHLEPLAARPAAQLARLAHPHLDARRREELLRLAGGNPLLIELLAGDHSVTPSLRVALADRMGHMGAAEQRVLRLLALLGRPAPAGLVGATPPLAALGDLLALGPGGELSFRHAALALAVADGIDDGTRRSLHATLARQLDDAEGAAHELAAGNAAVAAERALRAATSASPVEQSELLRLAIAATEDVGRDASEVRVRAVRALVDAGRWRDAIEEADRVSGTACGTASDAALERGRARWFGGDIAGARADFARAGQLAGPSDPRRATRALVEHAYLEVRDRLQGSLPLAQAALDAAREAGVETLRARSTLGAAQLYEGHPGWEATLHEVRADASTAGEVELEANVTYHIVSGLGFHGRVVEAVELGGQAIERLTRAGLGTWVTQFRCAHLIQQAVIAVDGAGVAEEAERFLREHRLFRNRGQVHLALLLALLDRAAFDEARAALERMVGDGLDSAEGAVHIAAAQAELAWHTGDVELAVDAVARGRAAGDAWFGLRLLAERSAMYVLTDAGHDAEIDLPSFAMPTWWPALHELEGLRLRAAGDLAGAAAELQVAADAFEAMRITRWAVRAGLAAAECDAARGDRTVPARRRRYADLARRSGLVGTLRRLGIPVRDELTPSEESVLRHVAQGCTTREIAARLGIAPGTVDQHIKSARIKLGAATRAEAAMLVDG